MVMEHNVQVVLMENIYLIKLARLVILDVQLAFMTQLLDARPASQLTF